MILSKKKFIWLSLVLVVGLVAAGAHYFKGSPVDFNTQVKPIFNKKCITCHGGVKREGGFSLLFSKDAFEKTESGRPAVIPGDADHSEMILRVEASDLSQRMPYKHAPLTSDEIQILRNWINQGAQWGEHWSYTKLAPPRLATVTAGINSESELPNPIDNYVLEKLNEIQLKPAPEALKPVLLRRLSLDLTGLPPSDKMAERYLNSSDPQAYEKLTDSLLSSPRYGERWAGLWMDLARYADTKGYEKDEGRQIWRYRDWVIHAFNDNMPYNQFLTEQLAGDLLPHPTDAQYIATAFHRNTMTNDEGGTDDEEFRTAAVIDRVNTTWDGLMGTTFGCVQCHSHPYDPFRHEEYYKFLAFFNNSRDEDTPDDYPLLRHFTQEDETTLDKLKQWIRENVSDQKASEVATFVKTWQPSVNGLQGKDLFRCNLNNADLLFHHGAQSHFLKVDLQDRSELVFRYFNNEAGGTWTIRLDKPDGEILKIIDLPKKEDHWTLRRTDIPVKQGVHDLYFSYSNPRLKNPDADAFFLDWFSFTPVFPGKGKPDYEKFNQTYWTLMSKQVESTTPVMMENPGDMARTTQVFTRGNWRAKAKQVNADVPSSLNPFPANAPRNRLGLAQWMTSEDNPLVARAMVNRVWEQLFGTGIAETLEDLGTQGIQPTHRELLDYLAYRYMHDWKWDTKRLIREIVTSSTYRRSSGVTEEMLAKDATNKYYARASRVRLSAESVRDQALAISGLLSSKMYGPSVMPFQPEGIWLSPYNGSHWKKSKGEDQHRRALYTYWKRTAPYPAMISFDGVAREVCVSRRIRTNTPLQALVTLNDSSYVDIARHFAIRMGEGTSGIDAQLRKGYQLALGQKISPEKFDVLKLFFDKERAKLSQDADRARRITADPNGSAENAALVMVANVILNLDEVITRN